MVGLLDVNMLIALAWPSHVHHAEACSWFDKSAAAGWATCPMTQCGFVRISSNPRIIPEAVTPRHALGVLEEIVQQEHHTFWPDEIPMGGEPVPTRFLVGHRQVTDAYLLGLAIHHGGRLVTLNSGVSSLLSRRSPHLDALHVVESSTRSP